MASAKMIILKVQLSAKLSKNLIPFLTPSPIIPNRLPHTKSRCADGASSFLSPQSTIVFELIGKADRFKDAVRHRLIFGIVKLYQNIKFIYMSILVFGRIGDI